MIIIAQNHELLVERGNILRQLDKEPSEKLEERLSEIDLILAKRAKETLQRVLQEEREDKEITLQPPVGEKPQVSTPADLRKHHRERLRELHAFWKGFADDCRSSYAVALTKKKKLKHMYGLYKDRKHEQLDKELKKL